MAKLVKSVVGGIVDIFTGGGSAQSAPAVAAPTVMPSPDDEAIRAAKKKSIAAIVGRQGRASTILSGSDGPDTLGV